MKRAVYFLFGIALSVVIMACAGGAQVADGFGAGVPLTGEWVGFNDENDGGTSTIDYEVIDVDGALGIRVSGNVTTAFQWGFVGWTLEPDEAGLELLRNARAISFYFTGDGQRQTIQYRISTVSDYAFHQFHFVGEPGETQRVEVPMRFFMQPAWGQMVTLRTANAESITFQTHEGWRPGSFEVTIWDVRVHP